MESNFCRILICGLMVAMATGAPVSSDEKLVSVKQADESVDRAKRADEEIVFGNQQNKARVMAKKSDLSNVLAPVAPQGEQDEGSEVIVHKEMPVDAALDARAEAALDRSEQEGKMSQAIEAAMASVAQLDEDAQDENTAAETDSSSQEMENVLAENGEQEAEDVAEIQEAGDVADPQEAGDVADLEEVGADDDDADLAALQKATAQVSEVSTDENNNAAEEEEEVTSKDLLPTSQQPKDDQVDQFLHELQNGGEGNGLDLGLPNVADKDMSSSDYQNMYRYMMMTPYAGQEMLQRLPYIYYRRRRSSSSANNHQKRRIKRDLLDDSYYNPYDLNTAPYLPVDVNDALIADPDQYVPLTDEEAEYLYKRLIGYLINNYEEEEEETEDPYQEIAPVEPYDQGYEEDLQGGPFPPYQVYNGETAPQVSSPYDEGYPYGPVDLDTYTDYAKRGMVDYYPQEEDKRYFFPFNDEPETHWGAFVPEKRNYDEAIQRLQRLAMALSDNPGPYYREMLQEYRRK